MLGRKGRRTVERLSLMVGLAVLVGRAAPVTTAQTSPTAADRRPSVTASVRNDTSAPLRSLRPILPAVHTGEARQRRVIKNLPLPRGKGPSAALASEPVDPAIQESFGSAAIPAPVQNFEGVGNVNNVLPPDTNGDVGPNHYMQWVNLSFQIFDKTGAPLTTVLAGRTLWQGFGGLCETNDDGDPIVLYDHLADRWMVSQFALSFPSTFHQCIAVSASPDPLGAWHRYDFPFGTKLNDYPKFGVWPDGYYMSVNQFLSVGGGFQFAGAGAVVYEREQMLQGLPARQVKFDLQAVEPNFGGMLPSDLDGPPPPAGAPNVFAEVDDADWIPGSPVDAMRLWQFHVDWSDTASSTFGLGGLPNAVLPTANFNPICTATRSCIPQPGTAQRLDAIGDRLMFRLQYRNFGEHESLVVNHTVNAGTAALPRAGVRWYEVREPAGTPVIHQQGTYAPPDSEHRWMASAAMDGSGNIALGYSVSSAASFPSIRYAARLAGDPPGDLTQGEGVIIAGTGSQTSTSARWGDYSMLAVDPDGCTFWFTSEYLQATGSAPWKTRVGSFRLASCAVGDDTGSLEGRVTDAATGDPLAGASVAAGPFSTQSDADGSYRLLNLPVGTHEVTASRFGYDPATASVLITTGGVTTQDFALSAAEPASLDGYVLDGSGANWPLYATVSVSGPGFSGVTVFTDPVTGYFSADLVAGLTYTLTVDAVYPGYSRQSRTTTLPSTGATERFDLTADAATCSAPGYGIGGTLVLSEAFEDGTTPAGWSVVDNAGTGAVWTFDNPGNRTNLTGGEGGFAIADSDAAGRVNMDSELVTPTLDLSGLPKVTLEFDTDFRWLSSSRPEVADVDVSNDGGATWTNVWRRTGANDRGPRHATVDISPLAARQSRVKIRFRYYNGLFEWWWQVDNVSVGQRECVAIPGGLVVGNVYDGNTGVGLDGSTVRHDLGGSTVTKATPADGNLDEGFYWLFTPLPGHTSIRESLGPATRTFTASKPLYGEAKKTGVAVPRGVLRLDFELGAAALTAAPPALEISLPRDQTGQVTLTLKNGGTSPASFTLKELNRPPAPKGNEQPGPFAAPNLLVDEKHQDDRDTRALKTASEAPRIQAQLSSDEAGRVVSTFDTGLAFPWGAGFDLDAGDLWIGNIVAGSPQADDKDHRFLRDGTPTGDTIDTRPFRSSWAADMTYDPLTGKLWQVNVGGDNCVYELDPLARAATGHKICPAFGTSERGLAFDPATDTFFAGSWNDQIIKRFDRTGRILESRNVGLSISGLAFNADTRHLFVLANGAAGFDAYVLDVDSGYRIIGSFDIEGLGDAEQAGLEIDCSGHLWAVNQATKRVIEVDSGETGVCGILDIPWVTLDPRSGAVPASGSRDVTVAFDSTGLGPGVYHGQIVVGHDTPYAVPAIPVTLTVLNGPQTDQVAWTNAVGVAVSGNSLTKTAPTAWGNAGAVSTKAIVSGDGYVDFTVGDTTTNRSLGLSNGDSGQHYADIDFAIYVSGGRFIVHEQGVSRGVFGAVAMGDRLRVAVVAGVVHYSRNGQLLYRSTAAPRYPLLVDTALHGTGATLKDVMLSGRLSVANSPGAGSAPR